MLTFLTLILLTPFSVSPTAANDWPCFGGPHRDNTSSETGLVRSFPDSGPEVLWTVPLEDGYSGAAVRDGQVFIVDRILNEKDVLRVLSLESGEEIWRFEHEVPGRLMFPGARSTPAVEEDVVYVQSGFGPLYCVDRETHELVWSVDMIKEFGGTMPMFGYSNSPLVHEDFVLGAPMGAEVGLVALDRETGEVLWKTGPVGSSHSTPCIVELLGQPQIVISGANLDMSAFENPPEDAPEQPTEPPPGVMKAQPAESIVPESMADMTMPGTGLLSSFSLDGELLWQTDSYYCSTPIPTPIRVDDEHLFMTGGYKAGSVLFKASTSDDKVSVSEVFRHEKGAQIHLPVLHDGHLYVLVNENANEQRTRRRHGGLMCLDLEGNEKWRTGDKPYFGRGHMIHADGMLIIQDGRTGTLRLVEPNPEEYRCLAEANIFGITDRRDYQMWAPMALAHGRLVLRSQGELKCVNLGAKQ